MPTAKEPLKIGYLESTNMHHVVGLKTDLYNYPNYRALKFTIICCVTAYFPGEQDIQVEREITLFLDPDVPLSEFDKFLP